MKMKIYIETSFISYLVGRRSKNLVLAAYQELSQEWWEKRSGKYDLFSSQITFNEASIGDPEVSQKRLEILQKIPFITITSEVIELSEKIINSGVIPKKATPDALHISIATVFGMDFLLTWNCRHIANATIQKIISQICLSSGFEMPTICTPIELLGG
ncbi:MAG: type II toxin-antitoxin system VapC family toxin [Candidatus Riflebacteria bacterium]|nr:type II toxin-antitoxin system VapC family toxin [Candidatus Riflebacteria bacterium]